MKTLALFSLIAIASAAICASWAQPYPSRPVTMVVPLAAGGPARRLSTLS
jgi:tripartite-type tricarboxylate transporter receptor subunit TctC